MDSNWNRHNGILIFSVCFLIKLNLYVYFFVRYYNLSTVSALSATGTFNDWEYLKRHLSKNLKSLDEIGDTCVLFTVNAAFKISDLVSWLCLKLFMIKEDIVFLWSVLVQTNIVWYFNVWGVLYLITIWKLNLEFPISERLLFQLYIKSLRDYYY